MTLIVLIILAAVSLSAVFSDKGVFERAESAGAKYNEAKAREVLETVLMTDGQMEKHTNPKYNQDEFLDELIKSEIPGSDVKGNVVIVGEYAYELDRSVPKIGRYLGKAENLVFPTVTATEPVLATDYRTASFTVTALEEKNGINKIEIWFNGEKIEKLTKTYDNVKTEITENFTVNKNGKYTIKAYGDLMANVTVEVIGIVPAVEFSPNGNTEWKKSHSTKITVKETGEQVTSLKYKWTTSSTNSPAENEFIEICPTDNIITGKDFTGTYYLWVLLTTETGKTNICGSEGFNFDNEGPIVELTSTPTTDTSFTLTATANDNNRSGIAKYEFYVDGEKKEPDIVTEEGATYTWNGNEMVENKRCYVIVYDKLENQSRVDKDARTLLHAWNTWDTVSSKGYEIVLEDELVELCGTFGQSGYCHATILINKPTLSSDYRYINSPSANEQKGCNENSAPGWLCQSDGGTRGKEYRPVGYVTEFVRREYSSSGAGWTYYYFKGYKAETVNITNYSKRT